MDMNKKLVLASASPRRAEILKNCGFEFEIRINDVDESVNETLSPQDYVMCLSERKAMASEINFNEIIISADSVVVFNDEVMGKPKDENEAFAMIKKLSGETHNVYTGVSLRNSSKIQTFYSKTQVLFYELSDEKINQYIKTGEAMDKAGAYGIQGKAAVFVKEIHGDYFNIVGLPVAKLSKELEKF